MGDYDDGDGDGRCRRRSRGKKMRMRMSAGNRKGKGKRKKKKKKVLEFEALYSRSHFTIVSVGEYKDTGTTPKVVSQLRGGDIMYEGHKKRSTPGKT